ncbi:hypothetical protein ACLQ8Z_06170 [Bordetella hinzii]|uniref:hypothetical protein n=1 Tax=Bordetella hinzii TaxID=103855 RepID=UPI000671C153|nr:hypothetical protein [Bordetella hinzii]AKQ55150.1 hypothetical protein ACR54_01830 [Bordetella hinzii]SNV92365.1 phage protein [Bordetella hinzii]
MHVVRAERDLGDASPHTAPCRVPAKTRETASRLSDNWIISVLSDLFAGHATKAFGETREWWAEALIDAGHDDLCRLALPALSAAAHRDLTAGAAKRLRDELLARARFLMDKARAEGRELQP